MPDRLRFVSASHRLPVWMLVAIAALPIGAEAMACSLVTTTDGLAGDSTASTPGTNSEAGAEVETKDAGNDDARAAAIPDDAGSCRTLREVGVSASGVYTLQGDAGAYQAYCDMDSFGGGWTLVTAPMIASDQGVQDYAPSSPSKVDVGHVTGDHGGIGFTVDMVTGYCSDPPKPAPGHAFTVAGPDGWKQIMATYTFRGSAGCWILFGDSYGTDTNVRPFELGTDLFDRDKNMAHDATGAVVPYAGLTNQCADVENFWDPAYKSLTRSIRVVQRRRAEDKPAGLAAAGDCGNMGWDLTDIYVR
ncbi:hypothetical protein AKJ09_11248 [Labilithrix luteola]|uniref:Fibrinogen C-terminal domain-containing protein n=1 Tax=Labilithrix luteola TaxID=1391654 RepID=A0A0K1QGM3_9BACT|nr:fibrinogen-like YCDxxxxGGGW domain-containing protein [Labilithrix luteola]AKV04585.1 hypothetical protein AKJ09_11248 [Labilithrix luteola]